MMPGSGYPGKSTHESRKMKVPEQGVRGQSSRI